MGVVLLEIGYCWMVGGLKVTFFIVCGYFGAGDSSDVAFKRISSIFHGKCLLKFL